MNIEFIFPPNSHDVIASAELNSVPQRGDVVSIGDKSYLVHDLEWVIFDDRPYDDRVGVLVNLVETK